MNEWQRTDLDIKKNTINKNFILVSGLIMPINTFPWL